VREKRPYRGNCPEEMFPCNHPAVTCLAWSLAKVNYVYLDHVSNKLSYSAFVHTGWMDHGTRVPPTCYPSTLYSCSMAALSLSRTWIVLAVAVDTCTSTWISEASHPERCVQLEAISASHRQQKVKIVYSR